MNFNSKFDPVLAESRPASLPPALQNRLEKLLAKDEKVLWAAQTRINTDTSPISQVAYVLTNRRAITLPFKSDTYRMIRWKAVNRVTIKRWFNRNGKLTLASLPYMGDGYLTTLEFKNCPQIERVQQIVERLLLGADSDPFSLPEAEEIEPEQDAPGLEGGLPLRWRSRLEAELLPDEQLLWVGRANSQVVQKSLKSCLSFAIIFFGIIIGLVMLTGDHLSLPITLIALGLITGLTLLLLAFCNFVILNTAYAVTNRRAMQVRGMRRGATSRNIEFYLNLKIENVKTDDTFSHSYNADYTDLILFNESTEGEESAVKKFEFTTIPKQEAELVKELLQQVYRPASKEAPRPSFGDLAPAPPPSSSSSKRRSRKQ